MVANLLFPYFLELLEINQGENPVSVPAFQMKIFLCPRLSHKLQ